MDRMVGCGLAQDREQWQAVINARFYKRRGVFLLPERLFASQRQLCCMEL
jgi:hypothetical protein